MPEEDDWSEDETNFSDDDDDFEIIPDSAPPRESSPTTGPYSEPMDCNMVLTLPADYMAKSGQESKREGDVFDETSSVVEMVVEDSNGPQAYVPLPSGKAKMLFEKPDG